MLDISFLNSVPQFKSRSGMEFLDWQSTTFFQELVEAVKETYDSVTHTLALTKADRNQIQSVIKKHSNITMKVNAEEYGNLAVDAGFISPNSVLNNPGLDKWVSNKYTKVSDAFKELKKNVLKGYCDLRTGKVEGDFKNIEFNLYINVNLPSTEMEKTYIKESGVSIHEAIAAGILHECGHVFFGLHYLSSTVIDNAMMAQTVKMVMNEPDVNRRAVIVKDLKKELDINLDENVVKGNVGEKEVVILFEKGLVNRDYRRTLSLGVTEMTAEVLADAYSIRMGASHALMGLLGSFYNKSEFWGNVKAIGISLVLIFTGIFAIIGVYIITFILAKVLLGSIYNLLPGTYDSPYRRMKTILRDNISYLSTNPQGFSKDQIRKMTDDAKEMEKMVTNQKSFFEATAVQRTVGYIFNGSDFRKTDFEHYTAELASSNLALYTNLFSKKD